MKIKSIQACLKNLALTKPYRIAGYTFSKVENVFLKIELENGMVGLGAANPAEEVVGENCAQTLRNLQSDEAQEFVGRDIRHFRTLILEAAIRFPQNPGTLAALDIALHDAFGQFLGIPIVEFYGRQYWSFPTSVTIGIMGVADTLAEGTEYIKQGFRVLKLKTGDNVAEDIERIRKLREKFGRAIVIRVDTNQGYDLAALQTFLRAAERIDVELIEQPLPDGQEVQLLDLSPTQRRLLVADESLKDARSALKLAHEPIPYGIFNIKLMKCGGILGALDIAAIARPADIGLFWGCNDESIASITAALHVAFACPHTRYLDLDGSFDLAEDLVSGGFILRDGCLELTSQPGLGLYFNPEKWPN